MDRVTSARYVCGGGYSSDDSGQTHDACAVPAINVQRQIQSNVESFTLTGKLNAVSENLSFLR